MKNKLIIALVVIIIVATSVSVSIINSELLQSEIAKTYKGK